MGQPHEQDARLGQSHDGQGDDDHEYEQENGLAMEEKPEHETQDAHLHGGSSELDMSDHSELTVFETQELDENMELAVIQHDDMAKLVPVGYGIKKLQIMLTIIDDLVSVDTLIEEHLTVEPCNEYVQSCDIVAFNKI